MSTARGRSKAIQHKTFTTRRDLSASTFGDKDESPVTAQTILGIKAIPSPPPSRRSETITRDLHEKSTRATSVFSTDRDAIIIDERFELQLDIVIRLACRNYRYPTKRGSKRKLRLEDLLKAGEPSWPKGGAGLKAKVEALVEFYKDRRRTAAAMARAKKAEMAKADNKYQIRRIKEIQQLVDSNREWMAGPAHYREAKTYNGKNYWLVHSMTMEERGELQGVRHNEMPGIVLRNGIEVGSRRQVFDLEISRGQVH